MTVQQSRLKTKCQKGFSLLEALVAMAVGLVVVGAGFMLFQQATNASRTTLSKTEMEQNGRAALNFMMQDVSVAATDYQQGVGVPQTGSTKAVFGCTGCSTSTFLNNLATPIMPYDKNSMSSSSDTITVIYVDNTWPPTAQTVVTNNTTAPPSATISAAGDQMTITTANFNDPNGVARNYQDTLYGSKVGDVMLIWNPNGYALASVTAVGSGGVLTLGADALHLNQTTATAANVAALKGGASLYPASTAASRVKIVTYFVTNTAGPDGVMNTADDIPVLMRQVNGDATATEVADYVQNLQLTYDLYDPVSGLWQFAATGIGGAAPTVTDPTQIRKINMALQMRSQNKNSSGTYDYIWVSTAVSPRDLSFSDRYK
jgi:prepilin-type N-terminal cleavage/methylation domain-containing protein